LESKSDGHKDLLKEISNLKMEINKQKDSLNLNKKELEISEQSKSDLHLKISKICEERDK